MHAVGNVYNSRTRCHRGMWTILMILSASLLLFQLYSITNKFLGYPVSTTVSVNYQLPINFPTVTICNLNPIKYSNLKAKIGKKKRTRRSAPSNETDSHDDHEVVYVGNAPNCPPVPTCEPLQNETTEDPPTTPPATTEVPSEPPSTTPASIPSLPPALKLRNSSEKTFSPIADRRYATQMLSNLFSDVEDEAVPPAWLKSGSGTVSSDHLREQQLLFSMNTISRELREHLTYHPHDVLMDCSFLNNRCTTEDFVEIESARYGSCFLFNSGMNSSKAKQPIKKVYGSGAGNSLTLTLYVDQGNYLPNDSPIAGYKVIVHSQDSPPIPEEEGAIVKPGQFASMGVKTTVFKRAEAPYGRCKEFTEETNRRKNMFVDQLPFSKPTVPVCIRTCQQLEIIHRCGCYSLLLGFANAPAFDEVRRNRSYIPACMTTPGTADALCLNRVMKQIASGQLDCKERFCREHVCKHYTFEVSLSDGIWPAGNSLRQFKKRIARHPNLHVRESLKRMKNDIYSLRDNYLQIQVYFSDLTVLELTTEPNYRFMDLLSDIGGNAGLWLGLSVFTVFEIGAFIFDMLCGLYASEEDTEQEVQQDEKADGHIGLEL